MNKKNATIFLGVVVAGLIGLFALSPSSPSSSPATPAPTAEQIAAAVDVVKAEALVLDAVYTDAEVLYASMKSDGTRRDGYAEYLCGLLSEHGITASRVKIVEAFTQKHPERDNAFGVLMGEAVCR